MDIAAQHFAERFAHWGIRIPKVALRKRRAGRITKHGWLIQYCFGRDEHGEYLDYYAAHRMTCDTHMRLYAGGEQVELPAISTGHLTSKDPVENARLEREYYATNQAVVRMMLAKGFDAFTLNNILHAGLYGADAETIDELYREAGCEVDSEEPAEPEAPEERA